MVRGLSATFIQESATHIPQSSAGWMLEKIKMEGNAVTSNLTLTIIQTLTFYLKSNLTSNPNYKSKIQSLSETKI